MLKAYLKISLVILMVLAHSDALAQQQTGVVEDFSSASCQETLSRVFTKLFSNYHRTTDVPSSASCQISFVPSNKDLKKITISLEQSSKILAYSSLAQQLGQIVLSSELLSKLDNDSQLAFVLAHEMAHIKAEHLALNIDNLFLTENQLAHVHSLRNQWELDADAYAATSMKAVGYNLNAVAEVLNKVRVKSSIKQSTPSLHPSSEKRIVAVEQKFETAELF